VTDSTTHIEFVFTKSTLNDIILQQLIDFTKEKLISENYRINFSDFNLLSLSCAQEKGSFICVLEAALDFNKSAGIFSIQASGKIELYLNIRFSVNRLFELNIDSELTRYVWKNAPALHMGTLDVSLETLSDCALKHFTERFLKMLDAKIETSVNITAMLDDVIRTQCTNHLLMSDPGLFMNICPMQIQLFDMHETPNHFVVDFYVEFAIRLSSEPLLLNNSCNPSFFWLDNKPATIQQTIDAEISTAFLTHIMNTELNGIELGGKMFVFENTNIILNGKTVKVQSSLVSPLRGDISVEFVPVLDSITQHVIIRDLNIKISPENILYKITAPVIEKVLEQWIQSKCPWDIHPYFTKLRERLPVLSLAGNSMNILSDFSTGRITNFSMKKDHLNLSVLFVNPAVKVTS